VGRFRTVFPLGSATQVVALDEDKAYAGIVLVAEAHASELDEAKQLRDILHHRDDMLVPTMTVKEAIEAFDQAEAEALAVVQTRDNRNVVGLLTEAFALRRYSDELERRRKELIGE
jgi:CIC family chloride channel protein